MKIIMKIITVIMIMSYSACSQDMLPKIYGNWLYIGEENTAEEFQECPDLLNFDTDGFYKIINDCYGENIKEPIIEKGKWTYDPSKKRILLTERVFYSNYKFFNSKDSVVLQIQNISNKEMKVSIADENGYVVETYERQSNN